MELSNTNKVDILTTPMSENVLYLNSLSHELEKQLEDILSDYIDLNLIKIYDLKNLKLKDAKEQNNYETKLKYYFALKAAIYHLNSVFNRPASFI